MTISVVQAVASGNLTSGAVASVSVNITPTAGNKLVAFATWSGTGVSATVADNQNAGNYSAKFDELDVSNDQEMQVFVMEGPGGAGVSGSATTVTVTPNTSTAGVGLWVFEVTGADTSAYDTSTGQVQATPTTGTDATTSGTLSMSSQPAIIIAVSINTGPTGVNAPTQGTGFTSHGTSWAFAGFSGSNPLARAESKRVTSTSGQAGTFTALGNDGHLTLAISLLEAGAGVTTVVPNPRPRVRAVSPRPGRAFVPPARLSVGLLSPPAIAQSSTLTATTGALVLTGNDAGLNYVRPPITGATQPQPRTLRTSLGRIPIPGIAQLGTGILATGSVLRALSLTATTGTLTLTAQSANLTVARRLTATQATLALTAQSAGLGVTMPAATASLTLTGTTTNLVRSLRMTASTATLTLTAQSATLTRAVRLTATTGALTLTAQTTAFGVTMPCTTASLTLTAQAANLTRALRMSCSTGALTLTGNAAGLTYNSAGSHTLTASTGALTLTAQAAGLQVARRMVTTTATLALSAQSAGLLAGRRLTVATGALTLTGTATGTVRALRLVASPGSLVLTANSATLTFNPAGSHTLTAQTKALTLTANSAGLFVARRLVASLSTLTLTGQAANLNHGRPPLVAATGTLGLTGNDAAFSVSRRLTAVAGALTLTPRSASIRFTAATILIAPPPRYRTRRHNTRSRTRR